MFRVNRLFDPVRIATWLLALAIVSATSFATMAEAGSKYSGGFHGKGGYGKHFGSYNKFGPRRYYGYGGYLKSGSVSKKFGHGRGFKKFGKFSGGHNKKFKKHRSILSQAGRRDGAYYSYYYGDRRYRGRGGRGHDYGYYRGYPGPRFHRFGRSHSRFSRWRGPAIQHVAPGAGSPGFGGAIVISAVGGYGPDGDNMNLATSSRTYLERECNPGEYCIVRLGPEYNAPKIITLNESGLPLTPGDEFDLGDEK